jgi:hypothetical protein
MEPAGGLLRPIGVTSKLHPPAIRSAAAALVVAALALGCQAAGGGSSTTAATTTGAARRSSDPPPPAMTTRPPSAGQVPPGPGPFASDATDRGLATTIAVAVQRAFTPPYGSRELGGPPAGTWRDLGLPGGVIPADGEVVRSTWWKVPGRPQAVPRWLRAHEPRPWYGGGQGSFGPVAEPGDAPPGGQPPADVYQGWSDTFENFHEPAVIGAADLTVEEIRSGDGQTFTRVDSLVTWIPPRPAVERVPASARAVTITAEPMDGAAAPPGSPATVTDPAAVARIAALVNGLYRAGWLCAPPPPTPDRIALTFSAKPGGPPLATVNADLRGCRQVRFSVTGAPTLPLLGEVNDRLVPAILADAGLHWFS